MTPRQWVQVGVLVPVLGVLLVLVYREIKQLWEER